MQKKITKRKKLKINENLVKNLQKCIKEVIEDNLELKKKNKELECLLASAYDEIKDLENGLLEISQKYDVLENRQLGDNDSNRTMFEEGN